MKERKKKNIYILVLAFLLMFIGAGYAILSTVLTISSTSSFVTSWNIEMSIAFKEKSADVTYTTPVINSDKISGSINNVFTAPNDYITYTVTVKNKGKVNAVINGFDVSSQSTDFDVTNTFIEDSQIAQGQSYSFDFTLKLKDGLSQYPTDNVIHNISMNVEQDTDTSSISSSQYVNVINGTSSNLNTIGTEVTIGDEHFYVISSDSKTVTLLAKYNLLVGDVYDCSGSSPVYVSTYSSKDTGYNLQSSTAIGSSYSPQHIGTTIFSSSPYWGYTSSFQYDNNDVIKPYVENYKNLLESMYSITVNEARLIKSQEIEALGCTYSCEVEEIYNNNRTWIYNTTYWTGSSAGSEYVYIVGSNGEYKTCWYKNKESVGVRPVITISKKLFNN